jgi:hypothetical protein
MIDSLYALDLLPDASQKVRTMGHEDTKRRVQCSAVDGYSGALRPLRHTPALRMVGIAAAFGVVVSLGACAAMQQTFGGWFGAATPTQTPQVAPAAAVAPRVYYVGVEGLKVYSEASASSKVVGALSLYEKVTRTRLDRGYAYVESAKSGVKGWVNNGQLIWRLPGAPAPAAPVPGEGQPAAPVAPTGEEPQAPAAPEATAPAAPEATAPAAELPPTPTSTPIPAAPPAPKATARGVAPSIFNPY